MENVFSFLASRCCENSDSGPDPAGNIGDPGNSIVDTNSQYRQLYLSACDVITGLLHINGPRIKSATGADWISFDAMLFEPQSWVRALSFLPCHANFRVPPGTVRRAVRLSRDTFAPIHKSAYTALWRYIVSVMAL